jgi:hypothetical protein
LEFDFRDPLAILSFPLICYNTQLISDKPKIHIAVAIYTEHFGLFTRHTAATHRSSIKDIALGLKKIERIQRNQKIGQSRIHLVFKEKDKVFSSFENSHEARGVSGIQFWRFEIQQTGLVEK